MVGLGGGFILVPILRLVYGLEPAEAAGTSLALVVANSGAGALTYLVQKRVAVRTGLWMAAGGLPGGIAGAILVRHVSAQTFDWLFALLLIAVAADLTFNRRKRQKDLAGLAPVTDAGFRPVVAIALGIAIGLISSLFGIGGGIVAVPSLLYFSDLPVHAVSATSHFAIFLTSPVGLVTHAYERDIRLAYVLPLVAGGLCGGPIGARLSVNLSPSRLALLIGLATAITAASLVARHL